MKIKSHLALVATLTCLVFSCNPSDETPEAITPETEQDAPIYQDQRVVSQQNLLPNDDLLIEFQNSKAMREYNESNGTPLWNMANLVTYHNQVSAIIIPISSEGLVSRKFLISYFQEDNPKVVNIFMMDLSLSEGFTADSGEGINGRLSFSKTSGENVFYHTIENSSIVATQMNEALLVNDGSRTTGWECFSFCLRDTMDQLPGILSALCGGSLAACLATANPVPCTIAATCLGYYGGICSEICRVILNG